MASASDRFEFDPKSLEENIKEYLEIKENSEGSKSQAISDLDTQYSFSIDPQTERVNITNNNGEKIFADGNITELATKEDLNRLSEYAKKLEEIKDRQAKAIQQQKELEKLNLERLQINNQPRNKHFARDSQEIFSSSKASEEAEKYRINTSKKNNPNETQEERWKRLTETIPPDNSREYNVWYYMGTSSKYYLVNRGIIPPEGRQLTPFGATVHSGAVRQGRHEELINAEINRLKKAGISEHQLGLMKPAIRKQAWEQTSKEWQNKIRNWKQENMTGVKLSELQAWEKEAQNLGRSPQHLQKINQVIAEAKHYNFVPNNMQIFNRDFKAMQRERSEHQKLAQSQNNSLTAGLQSRGIRR